MENKVISRLRKYWKLEAGCAVLLPAVGLLHIYQAADRPSIWVLAAMLAASGLLIIGGAAWRMELARAMGDRLLARRIMSWLARSPAPALMLGVLGPLAAVAEWRTDLGLTPSATAALAFGILAALEYINYYVVQLQHFDHAPDFRRLLAGQGFRRPHLARAIAQHRQREKHQGPVR